MNRFASMGALVVAGLIVSAVALPSLAYGPETDLLAIKGYSPETIRVTTTQRSRQEWKEPAPPRRTPVENFWHNLYYNNWTGSFDDFGRSIIRDNN